MTNETRRVQAQPNVQVIPKHTPEADQIRRVFMTIPPPRLELAQLLKLAAAYIDSLSEEELEAMLKAQRESWARQDLD